MRLFDLVSRHYQQTTPVFFYDPILTQLEDDGAYITRMAPPTNENKNGGIYLPDVTTDEYYSSCISNVRILPGVQQKEQLLKQHRLLPVEESINANLLSLYMILHEEGHWVHLNSDYILNGLTGEEYLKDSALALEALGIKELREKAKRNPNYYAELQETYRKSNFEKYADDYSIKRLKEIKNL
ncbi:hypothetical protein [Paenibacillus sp. DMB5]|uniref:hypothetical protein n=1 Tax=Paenibacillus sp. DMB5 TaxID=1780103 RepID=UPI00076D8F06|nr:hypothetical protein [Paenibacillus sp. DMB5]KUP22065.1 hypothetical protein AWJ19_21380 [Paenibacillus sp. DMB5]